MTKIMLFTAQARRLDEVVSRLELRQIRVFKTSSISHLHDFLISRPFDAVIVDEAFLASRCVAPARHLWEARSPVTIIKYATDTTGAITAELFRIPDEISNIASKPGRDEREKAIMEALLQAPARDELCENTPVYDAHTPSARLKLSEEQKRVMHRKMRAVLEILERTGWTGVSKGEITNELWGKESKDRTKDVQIYICKLRRIVAENGYTISLENGRYILSKKPAKNETPI